MLRLIERSFPEKLKTGAWSAKLKEMIPSYGQSLIENPALCRRVRADTAAILHINDIKSNFKEGSHDPGLSSLHRSRRKLACERS
jgi:malate dehydrogenase (quinone)